MTAVYMCRSIVLIILISMISEEVYSSVSLTVEGGVSLVGEHCPGTVRLFCEGVDLTLLQWRLYYNDSMYSSEKFMTDSVNGTKKVFNNSSFGSVSVELVQVSQHSSKVFANFSSILILELSQIATEIHRISCGDPVNNNDTSVNISIVKETLPDVSNFSVRINTSSVPSIVILAVTWKQYVSL